MQKIENWGRNPVIKSNVLYFENINQLSNQISSQSKLITFGNGRSYGDASLQDTILNTRRFNSLISFDEKEGILHCQSGILIDEILRVFVPKGWFMPVTPGTKFITIGGAVAADVHGKNHHLDGSFSNHIIELEVMKANGEVIKCSRKDNVDFYNITIGGMGLSGTILSVKFLLRKIETSYIIKESKRLNSLESIMDEFELNGDWRYSVGWIDGFSKGKNLGKGIFFKGNHASINDLNNYYQKNNPLKAHKNNRIKIPFNCSKNILNPIIGKLFNFINLVIHNYKGSSSIVHYDKFFYPLDKISNWNSLYGKDGFYQYQFVLPYNVSRNIFKKMFKVIFKYKIPSYLIVIKLFGDQKNFMSFPMKGFTVTFDFPNHKNILSLFGVLDKIVEENGGRLYLAKDRHMNAKMFENTYENAKDFKNSIAILNNGKPKFSSLLSDRLEIT